MKLGLAVFLFPWTLSLAWADSSESWQADAALSQAHTKEAAGIYRLCLKQEAPNNWRVVEQCHLYKDGYEEVVVNAPQRQLALAASEAKERHDGRFLCRSSSLLTGNHNERRTIGYSICNSAFTKSYDRQTGAELSLHAPFRLSSAMVAVTVDQEKLLQAFDAAAGPMVLLGKRIAAQKTPEKLEQLLAENQAELTPALRQAAEAARTKLNAQRQQQQQHIQRVQRLLANSTTQEPQLAEAESTPAIQIGDYYWVGPFSQGRYKDFKKRAMVIEVKLPIVRVQYTGEASDNVLVRGNANTPREEWVRADSLFM